MDKTHVNKLRFLCGNTDLQSLEIMKKVIHDRISDKIHFLTPKDKIRIQNLCEDSEGTPKFFNDEGIIGGAFNNVWIIGIVATVVLSIVVFYFITRRQSKIETKKRKLALEEIYNYLTIRNPDSKIHKKTIIINARENYFSFSYLNYIYKVTEYAENKEAFYKEAYNLDYKNLLNQLKENCEYTGKIRKKFPQYITSCFDLKELGEGGILSQYENPEGRILSTLDVLSPLEITECFSNIFRMLYEINLNFPNRSFYNIYPSNINIKKNSNEVFLICVDSFDMPSLNNYTMLLNFAENFIKVNLNIDPPDKSNEWIVFFKLKKEFINTLFVYMKTFHTLKDFHTIIKLVCGYRLGAYNDYTEMRWFAEYLTNFEKEYSKEL